MNNNGTRYTLEMEVSEASSKPFSLWVHPVLMLRVHTGTKFIYTIVV